MLPETITKSLLHWNQADLTQSVTSPRGDSAAVT